MTAKIIPSHEQTHRKFKYFGTRHLEFRQKCIGLLPQIYKGKIYEIKGYGSIFEYAGKLAGLSHEQVSRALNLHARFENLPALKTLLENGEVSINKLARIASIATEKNQSMLAENTKILSQNAIETLVRDIRHSGNQDGLQKGLFEQNSVRAHNMHNTHERSECAFDKSPENNFASPSKLLELKLTTKNLEKLLELQGKGIDINKIIETVLQNRNAQIAKSKEEATQMALPARSRYIPAPIRKIINEEQGNLCTVPSCKKPAKIIHHELPFSMSKNHDPRHLKKLCRAHHEIAHMINMKFHEIRKLACDSS